MKRIKQIIEALKVLSDKPSDVLKKAMVAVIDDADSQDEESDRSERILIENIMKAVIAIAEDMEKPKAEGEAKA